MTSVPAIPLVPVDEYLSTSYEHDVEYVDGVLVERGMPTVPHRLLQALLIGWFLAFEEEFGFLVVPELRCEIVERRRYRIPDVLLMPAAWESGVLKTAPWAVFEVLSPDDTIAAQTRRYREFWDKGVREIIVLDPEAETAFRWENNALVSAPVNDGIALPNGKTVPFSTDELFRRLAAKKARRS